MGQFFESHRTQLHITMYKLIVLAVVLVATSAQEQERDAKFLAGLPAGYAGLPAGHAGYAGIPYPYAAPAAIPAPVPVNYALPPVREVEGAPIVSQTVEKVEQHGYSIRY